MTQFLASAVLPMDGKISLAWERDRLCVSATVAGRPWTFYELRRDLSIIRSFTGGTNPDGPPQQFAPNDWRWTEMENNPDHPGTWPEMQLLFNPANTGYTMQATGRRLRGGKQMQWRDGHSLSVEANGHLEYDGALVPFPEAQGAACIAGDWLLAHNFGNNRLYRMSADDIGAYETHDVPASLFGQAQIAPDGTVVYSAYPDGKVTVWTPGGSFLDGEMPHTPPQNPNWAWLQGEGWIEWLCSGHDGQSCAIGSDSELGYLLIPGGSEPFARGCEIEGNETAIARWDSFVGHNIVVNTLSFDQPWTDPDAPPIDPPIDPPVDPPVTPPTFTTFVLASTHSGEAPLRVQFTAHRSDGKAATVVRWFMGKAGGNAVEIHTNETAELFFTFDPAGSYRVYAKVDTVKTPDLVVEVSAPPPPPPEPSVPWWIILWRAISGRR